MTASDIRSGLAELLGTTEEEAEATLRVALRQRQTERAASLVNYASSLSASIIQAEMEAIESERQRVISPLEASLQEKQNAHSSFIASLNSAAAEIASGIATVMPTEEEIRVRLES